MNGAQALDLLGKAAGPPARLPQVVHRSEITVDRVTAYIQGGSIHPFRYLFTVTLDNGQVHTVAPVTNYGTEGSALKAALKASGRMIEKGYEV